MNLVEREKWFKDFIELQKADIADFIACLLVEEAGEERLAYGSLRMGGDELPSDIIRQFGDYDIEDKFTLRLIYLPFSERPVNVQAKISKKQMSELSSFGVDLLPIILKAALNQLKREIIERHKEKNPSDTYRELNHILYDTW